MATACGATSHDYSASDVKAAFAAAGVAVHSAMTARTPGKRFGGVVLSADLGSEFVIAIYDDERDAKASYTILRSQASPHSFDGRQRNVVVFGDDLTPRERHTIVTALSHLSR